MNNEEDWGWRNREHPYATIRNSRLLSTFLDAYARDEETGKLSRDDRLAIVEQALVLLERNYVHLPLKRAMHAIDPIQRLRLLRSHLEEIRENQLPDEMLFHQEIQRIFTSTRDFHTTYGLPAPFDRKTAYLPFLIEEYFGKGNKRRSRFLVSKLAEGFRHQTFKPGVEILIWNGVPIKRAIEINGDSQPGSNLEARFANGLSSLTIRPLSSSLPPDEETVLITYRSVGGQELELRQEWWVFTRGRDEEITPRFIGPADMKLGLDIRKAAVNQGRLFLFAPQFAKKAERPPPPEANRVGSGLELEPRRTTMGETFRASVIRTRGTKEFAYIRIFTFSADNTGSFVREFRRLVMELPQNGLIIDVRNNPGGNINAGERLLQLLTPRPIKPELFELLSTPQNLELCRRVRKTNELSQWKESLEEAVETGALYSLGFPLTDEASCNRIGQVYFGPVVLITDALCYSTTDMFAAGFKDHEIGVVLGVSGNTGAGGANVWGHSQFRELMARKKHNPYRELPSGVGMGIAFRRSIRVGDRAGGRPLEDLGVVPDERHFMTKEDLLNGNTDLIRRAMEILASKKVYSLSAEPIRRTDGTVTMTATTQNISRLDLYIDDRPQQSRNVVDDRTRFRVTPPPKGNGAKQSHVITLKGFDGKKLVAVIRRKTIEQDGTSVRG
ncbi:MAG TPA: S41 family peptidase [Blastocatellia bacterium]|nr:S41 family peptidase [Blastocatellia bacterium]